MQPLLKALKNYKKMHEYEMKWFSQTQDLKPNSPKNLDFNILPLFLSNKSVVHKTQSIFQTWLVRP